MSPESKPSGARDFTMDTQPHGFVIAAEPEQATIRASLMQLGLWGHLACSLGQGLCNSANLNKLLREGAATRADAG